MKKLLIYIFAFFALSCSIEDDSLNDYQELLPIESAIIPETVTVGIAEDVFLNYLRPTNCHAYNDIYYVKNEQERTVAIVSTYFASNNNCTALNAETEASFRFKATEVGMYTFKFWQGKNDEGEDEYLIYEVEAID
jgi:hypothetical protein